MTRYQEHGLMIISAWSETEEYILPTPEELARWADTYGISTPVVADPSSSVYWRFGGGSLPDGALLGPGAVVLNTGFISDGMIESALGL